MDNNIFFRNTVFGGYNKDDVDQCVEELRTALREELQESQDKEVMLNNQMKEKETAYEAKLAEQKATLEKMLEEQNTFTEDAMNECKKALESQMEVQKAQLAVSLDDMKKEMETTATNDKKKITELQKDKTCMSEKYDSLNMQYEELLKVNTNLEEELNGYIGKKNALFKYELDSRARAEQIIDDASKTSAARVESAQEVAEEIIEEAQVKAAKILAEVEEKAARAELEYKEKSEEKMKTYFSSWDQNRKEILESTTAIRELQQQFDVIISGVLESNNAAKQKIEELYEAAAVKIEIDME